jgi:hypothetical protein
LTFKVHRFVVRASTRRTQRKIYIPWHVLRRIRYSRPYVVQPPDGKIKVATPLLTQLTNVSKQTLTAAVRRGALSGFPMSGMSWIDKLSFEEVWFDLGLTSDFVGVMLGHWPYETKGLS